MSKLEVLDNIELPFRLVVVSAGAAQRNELQYKTPSEAQRNALKDLIFGKGGVGWAGAALINDRRVEDGWAEDEAVPTYIDGHTRDAVAVRGDGWLPALVGHWSPETERQLLATVDPIARLATVDPMAFVRLREQVETESATVAAMLDEMANEYRDIVADMPDQDEVTEQVKEESRATLADRFIVPPFSVLDARQGYWQERKRAWIGLGLRGEVGRLEGEGDAGNAAMPPSAADGALLNEQYKRKGKAPAAGGSLWPATDYEGQRGEGKLAGVSVFDPVLCELAYRWFMPAGGHVLDPFAGEATKGIVAAYLGYGYTGVELREEQVEANEAQAIDIVPDNRPAWVVGDSADLENLLPAGEQYDFLWTSPPYYDLEIYSASDKDGSAFETYERFIGWYEDIFRAAVGRLRDNRFVAVKVGEVRDNNGAYYNFVGDNIRIFRDELGLVYYNEMVLVTAHGSLPVRAARPFEGSRKVGKTHQNVLVFCKGDPQAAADACGEVEVGTLLATDGEEWGIHEQA